MLGRLTCREEQEIGERSGSSNRVSTKQGFQSSLFMNNTSVNIPLHPGNSKSHLSSNQFRSQSSLLQRQFPELTCQQQQRSQSTFQESSYSTHSQIEAGEIRGSAISPHPKLPPILAEEPSTLEVATMPPQASLSQVPEVGREKQQYPAFFDLKSAYENMMVGYFMPPVKHESSSALGPQTQQSSYQHENQNRFNKNVNYLPPNVSQNAQTNLPFQPSKDSIPQGYSNIFPTSTAPQNRMPICKNTLHKSKNLIAIDTSLSVNQLTPMDVSSDCTVLDTSTYQEGTSVLKSEKLQTNGRDQSNSTEMSAVLNELSMFFHPQDSTVVDPARIHNNARSSFSTPTTAPVATTSLPNNVPYQPKHDPEFGRFSVLPPVMSSTTPQGSDTDSISLMSYASGPANAQNSPQMGMYYSSFSPFSVNFHETIPSTFASSPRYSGRSSYSGRSRNKRALSNSPLSLEGIDLNTIIRMSPTSLVAYINGSRSSSSCVTPGSTGEKTGCYGHLSARNSSSSPNSGSSDNRRSTSYTPQTGTPSNSSNITSDNSHLSNSSTRNGRHKIDFMNIDDNLLVMQAMQELESGVDVSAFQFNTNAMQGAQMLPEFENLQVLPQDLAAFRTEDYIPYVPSILPPVQTRMQPQIQTNSDQTSLPPLGPHQKPPPTYDQHMARKAILQKNSSSDSSSQPSNSSSFESSEGDKTSGGGGNSSTDTETNRMYACRWLDCTAVFHDQDEFVTHIEKVHIDQKKGDDFVCFWKLCPRRLHPFNARYKLLVHMRIHSGDKPNKCTFGGCKKAFSRLENLKIHLRSHTGERPYSCTHPGCSKTFSNSSDRTKHQKTHHETKPYVCQVAGCGKRYTDPSSLRKHAKKSHPEKKEPDRKKIKGVLEELDPRDLDECLVIQAIKPVTLCDASPPEPTDSGLGRSPRGSQPGSSSDHYPGVIYSGENLSFGETAQDTSPSSHHSSPRSQMEGENIALNSRVPVLPPIASPLMHQNLGFTNQTLQFPSARTTPALPRAVNSPSISGLNRGSSLALPRSKIRTGTPHGTYSACSNSTTYSQSDSSTRSALKS